MPIPDDYAVQQAMLRLLSELDAARTDADKNGWLSGEEVFRRLEEEYHLSDSDDE